MSVYLSVCLAMSAYICLCLSVYLTVCLYVAADYERPPACLPHDHQAPPLLEPDALDHEIRRLVPRRPHSAVSVDA